MVDRTRPSSKLRKSKTPWESMGKKVNFLDNMTKRNYEIPGFWKKDLSGAGKGFFWWAWRIGIGINLGLILLVLMYWVLRWWLG